MSSYLCMCVCVFVFEYVFVCVCECVSVCMCTKVNKNTAFMSANFDGNRKEAEHL